MKKLATLALVAALAAVVGGVGLFSNGQVASGHPDPDCIATSGDVFNVPGTNVWIGTDGPDNIDCANATHDVVVRSLGGDDVIIGSTFNDTLFGGSGDDMLTGLTGDDRLFGGSGDDMLTGLIGVHLLFGGRGDDTLDGGFVCIGGPGMDSAMNCSIFIQ